MSQNVKLPKVSSRKEFMDYLDNAINPPKYEDYGLSGTGRLKELKSYILESDNGFPSQFQSEELSCHTIDTDLEKMKILHVVNEKKNYTSDFFLDVSDDRFFVLHTNDLSENTEKITRQLVHDLHHTFDHTWFYSQFLEQLAKEEGNTFKGFGVNYTGEYLSEEDLVDSDIEDLKLSISGSLADQLQKLVEKDPEIERRVAYNKVRVIRGDRSSLTYSVQDDIHNNGYFSVKRGKSVQDHLHLVDMAKEEYSQTMSKIEDFRIGLEDVNGRTLVEGKPFDFEFPHPIDNLPLFLERFFSSRFPFKLWGMKTLIQDGYFKIMAVDLHTGSPMDFEVTSDMMRVYLFKGNCGNTILRLLTNLQMYFDSKIKCLQVN